MSVSVTCVQMVLSSSRCDLGPSSTEIRGEGGRNGLGEVGTEVLALGTGEPASGNPVCPE